MPTSIMEEVHEFGFKFAAWTKIIPESEIRRLLKFKVRYYFAGGKPGVLPLRTFARILQDVGRDLERMVSEGKERDVLEVFNYEKTAGYDPLRKVLADRLERDGVPLPRDEGARINAVTIFTGSQQALFTISNILIDPGDVVICPAPVYLGMLGPLGIHRANIVCVPTDEHGVIPEYVEKAVELSMEKFRRLPDFIYVVPDGDNPKGTTLPVDRRKKLYEIASRYKILIIEDAAYRDIHFEASKLPPIKSFDKENELVVYLRTTSKEAAVFRVGYGVIPKTIVDEFIKSKGYQDLCTSVINQVLLKEYYEKWIDKVLPDAVKEYKKRRDTMIKSVESYFPPGFHTKPHGGFFVWYESEKPFNAPKFLEDVALKNDVNYVPGVAFYPVEKLGWMYLPETNSIEPLNARISKYFNTMRLSYSLLEPALIEEGIKILGRLLSEHLK
ncbi:MAG: PLP-dependent aminotransferase family protein [Candidatus Njordarchaeota archaeon]